MIKMLTKWRSSKCYAKKKKTVAICKDLLGYTSQGSDRRDELRESWT